MIETAGFLIGFITMAVEGLERIFTTFEYNPPEKTKKLILYTASILLGILLSLGTPSLAREVFEGFPDLSGSIVGQLIIGVTLGFGSKATYYLIDWIKLRRQVTRAQVILQAQAVLRSPERRPGPERESDAE